jgi:Co/Zn/Cd efflux system component
MQDWCLGAFVRTTNSLVVNVHDFHLWEITSGMPALSAYVLVRPKENCHLAF